MVKENSTPTEKIFGSKTRAKLLELFFSNTNKSFYVREITRVIDEQINSVRRELMNLESIGVIRNETFDNKIYYAANMRHPYAHAFTEIFGRTRAGAVNPAKIQAVRRAGANNWDEYIRPVAKYLRAMVLFNRVPGQDGLDLLVIGDDRGKKLTRWAEVIEQKQGKQLNFSVMDRDDFIYRKSVKDRFVMDALDVEIAEIYDPEGIIES